MKEDIIHATDLSPAIVEECHAPVTEKGWTGPSKELKLELTAMQDLSFPNETFSHSITNFAIFALLEPIHCKCYEALLERSFAC